ncbi:hypothetical protein THASP1DRAFT_22048 [Thamnocephalis sphaerospora]|uniref:Uncharacterized protein n=1 Tax=Thamnocephalis sphaerospora TaxID=78915 RepID=A0A4P9XXR8_9FUNG|nr:hypothetical protein THASP1DRAFT_22048 [Thamnocephalis sphaerospora]|eukprot:RKP10210.1 hypothetical protein THASP1DRAFT_22048 [Thamnocephalis sphaerospora]
MLRPEMERDLGGVWLAGHEPQCKASARRLGRTASQPGDRRSAVKVDGPIMPRKCPQAQRTQHDACVQVRQRPEETTSVYAGTSTHATVIDVTAAREAASCATLAKNRGGGAREPVDNGAHMGIPVPGLHGGGAPTPTQHTVATGEQLAVHNGDRRVGAENAVVACVIAGKEEERERVQQESRKSNALETKSVRHPDNDGDRCDASLMRAGGRPALAVCILKRATMIIAATTSAWARTEDRSDWAILAGSMLDGRWLSALVRQGKLSAAYRLPSAVCHLPPPHGSLILLLAPVPSSLYCVKTG